MPEGIEENQSDLYNFFEVDDSDEESSDDTSIEDEGSISNLESPLTENEDSVPYDNMDDKDLD